MTVVDTRDAVLAPEEARPSLRQRLRERTSGYPRPIWVLTAAVLTLWTGRGMVLPFLIIYFSQIVGIKASLVGMIIAGAGLVGVAFVFIVAPQIDRYGGRAVLLVTLAAIAAATFLSAWAHSITTFLLVALLLYLASQSYWPSIDTVVAAIARQDNVVPSMALIRVGMSVGTGLGGLIGGLIASGGGLPEYQLLFMVSAVLILIGALIIWRFVPEGEQVATEKEAVRGSWADVLGDRTFMYGLVMVFAMVLGFSQLTMSVPAFLRVEAGINEGMIGGLFFMNTVFIVLAQVPVASWVNQGNVGKLLPIVSVVWGLAFVMMIATPSIAMMAILVFVAFTAGQLIYTPLTAVIAVRLAPVHMRGRYFSLLSITWGTSWAIATLTAGIALDQSSPVYLWPLMAGIMILAGFGALRLRGSVRLQPPEPAPAEAKEAAQAA